MTTKQNKSNANNANNGNNGNNATPTYLNIVGKVVKVMAPQQSDDRITFVLDKTFDTVDMKSSEVKESNMFGLNIYNVVSQISAMVPEIQMADALAMGAMVNPQIIALALTNADIEVKREFKKKGEKRENTNDVYANDCVVSKIIKVTTHIHPTFANMLANLIATKPAIVKTAAIPNVFNM